MDVIYLVFLIMLAACVGSFLNVVIYRLPRGESLVFPSSRCPSCGRGIRWYDNIPVLGWLKLRGRCRFCKAPISPRYPLIEAATAVLVGGLYACYFLGHLRDGVGTFEQSWPLFVAHAVLLCGLLVATLVDLEHWVIPLEVMWFCAAVGMAAAAFRPSPTMAMVSPTLVGVSFAASVGLLISVALQHWCILLPSFIDAEPTRVNGVGRITGVAITAECGVNPRKEILREVLFLLPALVLASAAALMLHWVPAAAQAWTGIFDAGDHPLLGPRLQSFGASLFGLLAGGGLIWAVRILGTLAFGKEAMGLGDAHLMAAVGAVTGWLVPTLAFFLAPFLGLLWAMYVFFARSQRELPYGPWLATAVVLTLLFHDGIVELVQTYLLPVYGIS